jgi:Na+/H+ antiporter NhaC
MMQNETRQVPGDAPRDYPGSLPRRDDNLSRFLGGSPLAVLFRLVLLSILVGVVLAAIGLDPWNIVSSIRRLFNWIYDLGFDAINGLWRYFLLGAVIVIPIWLISRLFGAPRGR